MLIYIIIKQLYKAVKALTKTIKSFRMEPNAI